MRRDKISVLDVRRPLSLPGKHRKATQVRRLGAVASPMAAPWTLPPCWAQRRVSARSNIGE